MTVMKYFGVFCACVLHGVVVCKEDKSLVCLLVSKASCDTFKLCCSILCDEHVQTSSCEANKLSNASCICEPDYDSKSASSTDVLDRIGDHRLITQCEPKALRDQCNWTVTYPRYNYTLTSDDTVQSQCCLKLCTTDSPVKLATPYWYKNRRTQQIDAIRCGCYVPLVADRSSVDVDAFKTCRAQVQAQCKQPRPISTGQPTPSILEEIEDHRLITQCEPKEMPEQCGWDVTYPRYNCALVNNRDTWNRCCGDLCKDTTGVRTTISTPYWYKYRDSERIAAIRCACYQRPESAEKVDLQKFRDCRTKVHEQCTAK